MRFEVNKPVKKQSVEHTTFDMSRFMNDVFRIMFLVGICGGLLYLLDDTNIAIFQSLLAGMFMVGGTHLTRRFLFNRLNLQEIALTAVRDNNMSAAIVFVAICLVLVAIMWLSMSLLK
jgi:hypothetical protein